MTLLRLALPWSVSVMEAALPHPQRKHPLSQSRSLQPSSPRFQRPKQPPLLSLPLFQPLKRFPLLPLQPPQPQLPRLRHPSLRLRHPLRLPYHQQQPPLRCPPQHRAFPRQAPVGRGPCPMSLTLFANLPTTMESTLSRLPAPEWAVTSVKKTSSLLPPGQWRLQRQPPPRPSSHRHFVEQMCR